MIISNKTEKIFFLAGDIFIFILSLYVSLTIRSGTFLSWSVFESHLIPFVFIFAVWIVVFFIAGLYDKYTTILGESISKVILNAQLANSVVAIIFFYFIPYFEITPKTILFINIIVSFVFVYIWRFYGHEFLGSMSKDSAVIIGSGEEMKSVLREINENPRSELKFVLEIDLDKEKDSSYIKTIIDKIKGGDISAVIIDLKDQRIEPILPILYHQIFSGVKFIDMDKVYESIFDRVPLSFLQYDWFLENVSLEHNFIFAFIKRLIDIIISIIILIVLVPLFPFIALAIIIETGKFKVIISQDRVGENGRIIKIHKFLTMLFDDGGNEELSKRNRLTNVGKFLRKTRLDESPQAWGVVVGDLSLVGPRPEMPLFVELYEKEIPYYGIRHIIRPGLSGWAQICQENPPKGGVNFDDTKTKLSYDLYYLKNKSLLLDLNIILKTLKTLLLRKGK